MIPIPAYFVTIIAFIYAAEYIGRIVYLRPIDYYWWAKVISGLYLGSIYLVYYLGGVPSDFRHILGRYGVFGLVAVEVFGYIISHIKSLSGGDRRKSWIARVKRERTND